MARRDPEPDLLDSPLVWDREAEDVLAGWLMLAPQRAREALSGGVRAEFFHGYVARAVVAAAEALNERGEAPDPGNIYRQLFAQGVTDISQAQLMALASGLPTGVPWPQLAQRVREGAARRGLAAAYRAQLAKLGTEQLPDLLSGMYQTLDDADVRFRPAASDKWNAVAMEIREHYEEGLDDRVPCTFADVDRQFGWVPRGSLVILGARTSLGKTSFATTLAVRQARAGRRVSFVSAEMDRYWIAQRYVGAMTGLSLQALNARTLDDDGVVRLSNAIIEPLPICTDDHARRWSEARARIRQHARELGGVDVVFIDYLQLLDPEMRRDERRYEALGRVSGGMKGLAKDLNCIIVALAQLNRGADDREEPRLSDLRESGNLEQDADVVWLLWRKAKDAVKYGYQPIRFRVAKNRFGPTGEVLFWFDGPSMRFMDGEDLPE